jgi:hypothetical protein
MSTPAQNPRPFPDVPASGPLGRPDGAHQHEAKLVVVADSDQPAQVDLGQPVARSPRVVLAAPAGDGEFLVAYAYRSGDSAQVLVVPVGLAGQEDLVDVVLVGTHHRVQAHRVSANRWELERVGGTWRVVRRTNRLLDGTPEARALLTPPDR